MVVETMVAVNDPAAAVHRNAFYRAMLCIRGTNI